MKHKLLNFFLFASCSLGAEQTLAIIKPDAVANKHVGAIIARYEQNGFQLAGIRMTRFSCDSAEKFYSDHKERSFYKELVTYMSSGPIVALLLEEPDAIEKSRKLIGDTDPKNAASHTIRADFGISKGQNAIHGSDGLEAAKREIAFFF